MIRKPILARKPASPRPQAEIIADINVRFAETLAHLADHPCDPRRTQANQQSDAERDTRGLAVEINL